MTDNPSEVVVDYLSDGTYGALEPIPFSDNAAVVYESKSVNDILQWVAVNYDETTDINVSEMARMASSNETTELIAKIAEGRKTVEETERVVSEALEEFLNAIMTELNKDDNDDPQRNDDSD